MENKENNTGCVAWVIFIVVISVVYMILATVNESNFSPFD